MKFSTVLRESWEILRVWAVVIYTNRTGHSEE
jgi:hypothetical protein